MMCFLPADTWIRLVLWMLIGLDVYAGYGIKHSKLEPGKKHRKGDNVLNVMGLVLSVLSIITGLWHQQTIGWNKNTDRHVPLGVLGFLGGGTDSIKSQKGKEYNGSTPKNT